MIQSCRTNNLKKKKIQEKERFHHQGRRSVAILSAVESGTAEQAESKHKKIRFLGDSWDSYCCKKNSTFTI